jgi:Fungal specific transcription factor domain
VSPIWLAQLFAILYISSRLDAVAAPAAPARSHADHDQELYLRCSAECLVLGKYAKPQKHIVEALLLHTVCRYTSNIDSVEELWIFFGVIVRVAMRLGYHRDAKHLSGISTFNGEMRRRTWAVIEQLDLCGASTKFMGQRF